MQEHRFDQWLVDGSPVFGHVPGGLLVACPTTAPIFLFRGTAAWGWQHIVARHQRNSLFHYAASIERMVWDRCGERGAIHASRDPRGLTVSIKVAPTAFIVLSWQRDFDAFSITTMYGRRPRRAVEPMIGQYSGRAPMTSRPVFAWLPYR